MDIRELLNGKTVAEVIAKKKGSQEPQAKKAIEELAKLAKQGKITSLLTDKEAKNLKFRLYSTNEYKIGSFSKLEKTSKKEQGYGSNLIIAYQNEETKVSRVVSAPAGNALVSLACISKLPSKLTLPKKLGNKENKFHTAKRLAYVGNENFQENGIIALDSFSEKNGWKRTLQVKLSTIRYKVQKEQRDRQGNIKKAVGENASFVSKFSLPVEDYKELVKLAKVIKKDKNIQEICNSVKIVTE